MLKITGAVPESFIYIKDRLYMEVTPENHDDLVEVVKKGIRKTAFGGKEKPKKKKK